MNFTQAKEKLSSIHQEHLLRYWDGLDVKEQDSLLEQVNALDLAMLKSQRFLIEHPESLPVPKDISPLEAWDVAGSTTDQLAGKERIAAGKVGCIVVAGGQGSRLGFERPKGLFPVTIVKHKTLFQLLAERVAAAGKQAGRPLSLAIMTSSLNDEDTRRYFEDNGYFDLDPEQVSFFVQGALPIVGDHGELFLQERAAVAVGPDGNGFALHHFYRSTIWKRWAAAGVEELCFIQVDNTLGDPFDAELVGYHRRQGAEVTLKATQRGSIDEKVGVVVVHQDKIRVLEYTELPEDERIATNIDGSLQYQVANLSIFCFSMSFIQRLCALPSADFPLHLAHKTTKILDNAGQSIQIKAWKCERFIFDVLPYAEHVAVLLFPRDECYAPLKSGSGADSLDAAQKAMQNLDRRTYNAISGVEVAVDCRFELSPQFYYPTPELLQRWKGVPLPPKDYIEP